MKKTLVLALLAAILAASLMWTHTIITSGLPDWLKYWLLS